MKLLLSSIEMSRVSIPKRVSNWFRSLEMNPTVVKRFVSIPKRVSNWFRSGAWWRSHCGRLFQSLKGFPIDFDAFRIVDALAKDVSIPKRVSNWFRCCINGRSQGKWGFQSLKGFPIDFDPESDRVPFLAALVSIPKRVSNWFRSHEAPIVKGHPVVSIPKRVSNWFRYRFLKDLNGKIEVSIPKRVSNWFRWVLSTSSSSSSEFQSLKGFPIDFDWMELHGQKVARESGFNP